MFQKNKINHNVVAECSNGENVGRYEFVESYDEDWGEISARLFEEEFGNAPTQQSRISYERI